VGGGETLAGKNKRKKKGRIFEKLTFKNFFVVVF
jgi:hypothetical protein